MGTFFDTIKTIETIEEVPSKKENELYNAERNQLISVAKNYIGTPYFFAGTDEKGFDCSCAQDSHETAHLHCVHRHAKRYH